MSERILVEGKDGRRRLLRVLDRDRKGRDEVLTIAPQRLRCYQGGCLHLAEVPVVFCRDHERRAAG